MELAEAAMIDADAPMPPVAPASDIQSDLVTHRGPPKAIRLLVPIWGRRYVTQFINLGLPTLLAPGNLPALAKALPCKLVFLTSTEDGVVLREHPACRHLASICEVEVQIIDDLITGDNYSTTITFAYARGVRAAGADMVDTCFFFLISDYVIADGSLAHVLARMQDGINGVLAGNFQVSQQHAVETFFERFDHGGPEIAVPARELMQWALRHLHPMTAANTVNFPLSHNSHSNRLFWRVDENTLIGRFYLMHMICIRPEVSDFVTGSSCDYSFIPEMCPSDNVEVLTDSDHYLVVEIQPLEHEHSFLRLGAMEPQELALSLSEWTTERHRKNAHSVIVFHGKDVPNALPDAVTASNAFIAEVDRSITNTPQPHRDHPYWIGAIEAHNRAVRRRNSMSRTQIAPQQAPSGLRSLAHRLRESVFGRPPDVPPWHPRWPDYRVLRNSLGKLSVPGLRLLIISPTPTIYADWLASAAASTTSLETRLVLSLKAEQYMPMIDGFDGCILMAGEEEFEHASSLMERIRPLLSANGFLVVSAVNGRGNPLGEGFNRVLVRHSSKFLDLGMEMTEVNFVRADRLRVVVIGLLAWLAGGMLRRPLLYYPLTALSAGLLLAISLASSLMAVRTSLRPGRNLCSSVTMVLRQSGGRAPLPDFTSKDELYRRANRYKMPPNAGPP
jgi:hypothetical protein